MLNHLIDTCADPVNVILGALFVGLVIFVFWWCRGLEDRGESKHDRNEP